MRYTILVLSLICLLGSACSDDNEKKVAPVIRPDAQGVWTDPRDGISYRYVRIGNQEWLSENMRGKAEVGNYATAEDTVKGDFVKYGYLYDFEAAKSLETDGWRLPSDEDWKTLECNLGMSRAEADAEDWRGDFEGELMMQDSTGTGLDLKCGGYWYSIGGTGERAFQVDGIYWTSTYQNEATGYVWCRMISVVRSDVRRLPLPSSDRQLSVRLVRDVQ